MKISVSPFLCDEDTEGLDVNVALVDSAAFFEESSASPFIFAIVQHVLPYLAIGPLSVGFVVFMLSTTRAWDHPPHQVISPSSTQATHEDLPSGLLVREKRRSSDGSELVLLKPVVRSSAEISEVTPLGATAVSNAAGTGVLSTAEPPTGISVALPNPPTTVSVNGVSVSSTGQ